MLFGMPVYFYVYRKVWMYIFIYILIIELFLLFALHLLQCFFTFNVYQTVTGCNRPLCVCICDCVCGCVSVEGYHGILTVCKSGRENRYLSVCVTWSVFMSFCSLTTWISFQGALSLPWPWPWQYYYAFCNTFISGPWTISLFCGLVWW